MAGPAQSSLSPDELRRLLDVGRALVSELDVDAIIEQVLGVARELTGARYAAVGVLSTDGESLERFVTSGIDPADHARIGALPRGRGVLGVLIRDPEPLRLADVGDHVQSYGFPSGHPPMRSFLGVPIRIRDTVYGNLYLTEKEGADEFTVADEESISVLADWTALAVDNARIHQSANQRRAELERAVGTLRATSDITRAIGGETELERVLELIVKRARAMLEARTLLIMLLDDERTSLTVEAMAGEGDRELIGTQIALEGTLIGAAVRTGRAQRLEPGRTSAGLGLERHLDPEVGLVVPLHYRSQTIGALAAFDRPHKRPFGEDDEELLASFAASASISVATARRVSEQQRRRAVEASERERARWARELHDETLQELAGLKVLLGAARGDDSALDAALEQIEISITGLRRLILELRPAVLDEYGLAAAVEALTDRIGSSTGIVVEAELALAFEAGLEPTRLAPDVESAAYRLVQEAVNNAVKHAEPSRIDVRVEEGQSALVVEIADDGRGFDPGDRTEGFGLVGMRERVELVGGTFELASSPGRGTTVRATFRAERAPG